MLKRLTADMVFFPTATIFAVVFTLFVGCAHKLTLDPSPPAAESNYATAEYRVRGAVAFGLTDVYIEQGHALNDINLQVQGYFDGKIKVDSGHCNISEVIEYKDHELVSIKIPGWATHQTCLIDITVIPTYPGEKDHAVVTYGFKGQVLVKPVGDYPYWYGEAHNVKTGEDILFEIPVPNLGSDGPPKIGIAGCGGMFQGSALYTGQSVAVALSDVVTPGMTKRCIFEGIVLGESAYVSFTWRVWSHDKSFSPLAEPRLEVSESKILKNMRKVSVEGAEQVGYIALDDDYVQGNKASFSYDARKDHILRLLTIKGRSVVCLWVPEMEEWACRN